MLRASMFAVHGVTHQPESQAEPTMAHGARRSQSSLTLPHRALAHRLRIAASDLGTVAHVARKTFSGNVRTLERSRVLGNHVHTVARHSPSPACEIPVPGPEQCDGRFPFEH